MGKTRIEWTQEVWNPLRGCSRVSEGCRNCYAERIAARFSSEIWDGPHDAVAVMTKNGPRWTGKVNLIESKMDQPLRWKKSRRIFVNSMSDLFHENVTDEQIDRIFLTIALAEQHTFQALTKRPERMRAYLTNYQRAFHSINQAAHDMLARAIGKQAHGAAIYPTQAHGMVDREWPPRNLWLGVSVEDQATADERIPFLLQTPAAVRWVSYEPALRPVNFTLAPFGYDNHIQPHNFLDWIVIGGESGPRARPFDLAWARDVIGQCKAAGVPVFVKQLGARQLLDGVPRSPAHTLKSKKGGDMTEWPEDLRIREWPALVKPTIAV